MPRHLSLVLNTDDIPEIGDDLPGIGRHVLVVDEHDFSRRLARRRLEACGFTVSFAEDVALTDGPLDAIHAIVSTSALFLALHPGRDVDDLPIIVTVPDDRADDHDYLEELYALGATTVVEERDAGDAVLEALWERKPAAAAPTAPEDRR